LTWTRLSAFAVALLAAFGLTSCASGSDGKVEWALGLQAGQCAENASGGALNEVEKVRVIPCTTAHAMEIYARIGYLTGLAAQAVTNNSSDQSDQEYPGDVALKQRAREGCANHFRAYLQTAPRLPQYYLTYLYPSVESWTAAQGRRVGLGPLRHIVGEVPKPDRSIICMVRSTDGPLSHSVRTPPVGKDRS
jgi:hypothetical protein